MIEWEHIPIWLRCTERYKIDPNLRGSIYGANRGWDDYCRKLSDEQVREIRASGEVLTVLAKKYEVAYSTIYQVKSGRGYRDVG